MKFVIDVTSVFYILYTNLTHILCHKSSFHTIYPHQTFILISTNLINCNISNSFPSIKFGISYQNHHQHQDSSIWKQIAA